MIEARGLTKRYGGKVAVDDLSFTVRPGVVTGFLGPNGAGKSTTMRMILGLDRPTSGTVLVDGRHYRDLPAPARHVGALLESRAIHPGRTAENHLLTLARTHGISRRRVDQVIDLVGLRGVARKRARGFSLGMNQRLGIASALLGDPSTLVLDEPVNGLDPEGIRWIRDLLRGLAAEGRSIMVSSHLMSEMALTATELIVIGRGRLIAQTSVDEFVRAASGTHVRVRAPRASELGALLVHAGATVHAGTVHAGTVHAGTVQSAGEPAGEPDVIEVVGLPSPRIGEVASAHGITLHELTPRLVSLEEAFMDITRDAAEFTAAPALAGGNR
ncbi:ABC transporter ATP-binding protein [Frankia sp. CNm7]|uniref:ABC transporter ATP-binding protein n=1 Tax=Frankia nepalensis TaxID=1836974 RepID=A0A937RLJ7_9ACTN|nr:ABC transporter ATP-binding protein [Frankia nepalensis]MBL7496223.1 ABC transporter ATP-binding protein [Frankia nepalensis]MBL7511638.1 ABC transporter ATP-binding protein [Frankia nepalensis]MBL7517737.1 ABC transporter ATP-binding protein [Frankia nepalensis]MBL7631120.1 ABC transporter ATP-binding protein [Frankia nepalensis]